MPGKERPAASRLAIQRPPTTEPPQKNLCRNNKKSSAGQPIRQTAERLDYRFLRSQPRVIGPGSLRRARPRQSDYNTNTQPKGSDHQRATLCLANLYAGKVKQSRLLPLSMAAFNPITYGRF